MFLFGEETQMQVDGMNLADAFYEVLNLSFVEANSNLLNLLYGGLLRKFGLVEPIKKAKKLGQNLIEKVSSEFVSRMANKKDSDLGINIIDLVVKHNRSVPEEKQLKPHQVLDNTEGLVMSSMDTTMCSVEFFCQHLALFPETQDELMARIVSKLGKSKPDDFETYTEDEDVQNFTKELLRMYTPSPQSFERLIVADMKVGKYNLLKGTRLVLPTDVLHHTEEHYPDSMKFKLDRFAKETQEEKRQRQILNQPFSIGKRACIGRLLGEINVELVIFTLLRNFEFKKLENFELSTTFLVGYSPLENFVKIRPRG